MDSAAETLKIKFVSKKKSKCLRTKRHSSESEDEEKEEENISTLLEDAKELRKLRRRPNGVSAIGLALGKKLSNEEELIAEDPFKLKTGGFIDMKALNRRNKSGAEELDAVHLGSVFSAETNRRDEDADMMKYIEEELGKRKGISIPASKMESLMKAGSGSGHDSEDSGDCEGVRSEDMLFEHLKRPSSSTKKSEEMLSNQMLSGIPEVDLGIQERIRNIEATEEAKLQLLRDKMKKKDRSMSFVPTNMAVNFSHHNRFNIDPGEQPKLKKAKKEPVEKIVPPKAAVTGAPKGKTEDGEKATDDFHFEKFKKQFRRF